MILEDIHLKVLEVHDYSKEYLEWFDDEDVVRFSNNQYKKFSRKSQLEYIRNFKNDENNFLFGIFFKDKHIGNIVLGPIDRIHKRAEISYIIGEKEFWGIGIGTYVISLIITLSKNQFNLNKLCASCASENLSSKKILLNNKFKIEGTRKKHLIYNRKWDDSIEFGLIL